MPRRTAAQEVERHLNRFFKETKAGYMQDIMSTRQPPRRKKLLAELDAFDKVEARYYHWLTSQAGAK